MQNTHANVVGWGVDARRDDRPGVPREKVPPQKVGNAHWSRPEQQRDLPPAAIERQREVTPVYGTVAPPRALSGLLRRIAYRAPDYKTRRWLLLILADRIDVIESAIVPAAVVLVAAGALGVAGYVGLRAYRE
ncbi:MAG: hypothetical protein JWP87_3560 [Labilithrix sp.]|jgi:hypothetical protein|nr:hypothetical protein [Labilithrix sp.]